MAIIARSSNTRIDSFWEPAQSAVSEHIRIENGKIRFEIEEGKLRDKVFRSELRTRVTGKLVNGFRMKIAFTLELGTDEKADSSAVIFQLWDSGSPSNSIQWRNNTNQIFYRISGDNVKSKDTPLFIAEKGKPVRVVVDITARSDAKGHIVVYANGNKVMNYKGMNLYDKIDPDGYPKIGLYDSDKWPKGIRNRVIYFSDIVNANGDTPIEELLGEAPGQPQPEPEHKPDPRPRPNPEPEGPNENQEVERLRNELQASEDKNSKLKSEIQKIANQI